MSKISILDCTLRDGAYINNGIFGDNTIKGIIENLQNANIEMIEVGWLKDDKRIDGSVYYNKVRDIEPFLPVNKSSTYLVMIKYGMFNIDNLADYDGKSVDAIRLVFSKDNFEDALEYSKLIKKKGYKLFLQTANTQSYSDTQLIALSKKCNEVMPEAISIVDTCGSMYHKDLQRIFNLLNKNLNKDIKLGFHSHNNLQLSFALSVEFVSLGLSAGRDIITDSSLCGMGRGAGDTCTELITNYLNLKYNRNYDLDLILDTIDVYMKDIMQNYKWGYDAFIGIAGQLHCHVNNVMYLREKHNISCKDLKAVLSSVPKDERKSCNFDAMENAYTTYVNEKF